MIRFFPESQNLLPVHVQGNVMHKSRHPGHLSLLRGVSKGTQNISGFLHNQLRMSHRMIRKAERIKVFAASPIVFLDFRMVGNEAANEVLQAVFGETAEYDGVSYRFEPVISRKQVLVPAITAILESHPRE